MMDGKYQIFFVLFLLLVSSRLALATPEVQSVSISNQAILISGSDFGTKTTAPPLKWETFDDGRLGATLTEGDPNGYWSQNSNEAAVIFPLYSTDYQRTSSSFLNIKSSCYGEPYAASKGCAQFWKNNVGFATTKKAFVSMWVRFEWVDPNPGESYQIKMVRLLNKVTGDSGTMSYPAISNFNWFYADDSKSCFFASYGDQTYVNTDKSIYSVSDSTRVTRTLTNRGEAYGSHVWFNVQIQYSQSSSSGAADATLKIWTQRTPSSGGAYVLKDVLDCPGETCSFDSPNPDGYSNLIDAIKFDWDLTNMDDSEQSITSYTDDIYIDNSWARVEIGDASTYDSCTHREMQIPLSWTDTSVKVSLQPGSFSTSDYVYLYIVNNDGDVSKAYGPFTLSGTPVIIAPTMKQPSTE